MEIGHNMHDGAGQLDHHVRYYAILDGAGNKHLGSGNLNYLYNKIN